MDWRCSLLIVVESPILSTIISNNYMYMYGDAAKH